MINRSNGATSFVLSISLLWALTSFAQDLPVQYSPEVINDSRHDTSLPVREMPVVSQSKTRHVVLPVLRRPGEPFVSAEPETAASSEIGLPRVGTTNLLNFDGISDRDGVAPPDTNASVGATQVVETVNLSYQVYNKSTGASIFGPAEISSIWAGAGGNCGSPGGTSDPVVLYDKAAGRWLITIVAFNGAFTSFSECIAVSTTSDATGSYHRYEFSFGTTLNDYPKFGVWPDAYYASYNNFAGAAAFIGAEVCAYNRSAMLAGLPATAVCFQRTVSDFSFLPSDLDGSTAPPAGEPNFFLELASSTTLDLFKFHVDFSNPNNSTFTGPSVLAVTAYTQACAATGTCIPQKGTSQQLDSLGDRLMFRLAYRNFGTHETLVATHSVKVSSTIPAGVRWYEIRSPNSAPTVFQQGTVTSSSNSQWMGSIGTDKAGDIAVGFSRSSSTTFPGIAYTGRVPTDALGKMESIATIHNGGGSQTGSLSRWGDYSSISIDPSDDCTFWYASEYLKSSGSFNWSTRLNSFKFTGCH